MPNSSFRGQRLCTIFRGLCGALCQILKHGPQVAKHPKCQSCAYLGVSATPGKKYMPFGLNDHILGAQFELNGNMMGAQKPKKHDSLVLVEFTWVQDSEQPSVPIYAWYVPTGQTEIKLGPHQGPVEIACVPASSLLPEHRQINCGSLGLRLSTACSAERRKSPAPSKRSSIGSVSLQVFGTLGTRSVRGDSSSGPCRMISSALCAVPHAFAAHASHKWVLRNPPCTVTLAGPMV